MLDFCGVTIMILLLFTRLRRASAKLVALWVVHHESTCGQVFWVIFKGAFLGTTTLEARKFFTSCWGFRCFFWVPNSCILEESTWSCQTGARKVEETKATWRARLLLFLVHLPFLFDFLAQEIWMLLDAGWFVKKTSWKLHRKCWKFQWHQKTTGLHFSNIYI